MKKNQLLQEVVKISEVNPARLMLIVKEMTDADFMNIYGDEIFVRIDITAPASVIKLFGRKK